MYINLWLLALQLNSPSVWFSIGCLQVDRGSGLCEVHLCGCQPSQYLSKCLMPGQKKKKKKSFSFWLTLQAFQYELGVCAKQQQQDSKTAKTTQNTQPTQASSSSAKADTKENNSKGKLYKLWIIFKWKIVDWAQLRNTAHTTSQMLDLSSSLVYGC